ncbi:MAG TPA: hypothetical protein VGR74_24145 [Actinomycetota bacterium]|nr:hypothetical protein [Actinomycetota bacterium]
MTWTELRLALAIVALLAGTAALTLLPWDLAFAGGTWLIGAGLAVSLPGGLGYHVQLYRSLGPRGALPPRWWWSPVALNSRLTAAERARVMPWFYLGIVGVTLCLVGCAVVATCALRTT